MKANMGMIDRGARLLLSITFFILYLGGVFSGVIAVLFLIIASIFLFTSLWGTCLVYLPFKIDTKEKRKRGVKR